MRHRVFNLVFVLSGSKRTCKGLIKAHHFHSHRSSILFIIISTQSEHHPHVIISNPYDFSMLFYPPLCERPYLRIRLCDRMGYLSFSKTFDDFNEHFPTYCTSYSKMLPLNCTLLFRRCLLYIFIIWYLSIYCCISYSKLYIGHMHVVFFLPPNVWFPTFRVLYSMVSKLPNVTITTSEYFWFRIYHIYNMSWVL